jgi:hypothetical protein
MPSLELSGLHVNRPFRFRLDLEGTWIAGDGNLPGPCLEILASGPARSIRGIFSVGWVRYSGLRSSI